jgi:hypothetical protein
MKFDKNNQHISCLLNAQVGDIIEVYLNKTNDHYIVSKLKTNFTDQFPVVAKTKFHFEYGVNILVGTKQSSASFFWPSDIKTIDADYFIIESVSDLLEYKRFYIPVPSDIKVKRIIKKNF